MVEDDELPAPPDVSEVGGKPTAVYRRGQLEELFTTEHPAGPAKPEVRRDSLKYIVESFDRDRDGHISSAELYLAANFPGIDLSHLAPSRTGTSATS